MKSVGTILKKARLEKGLEYKDIFADIKIQPKFLRSLEESDWSAFSGSVHAKGFLKNYAEYLGLDTDEILAFWRREYKENPSAKRIGLFPKPIHPPRLVVTPAVALTIAGVLSISLFVIYLAVQYQSFAGAPILILKSPKTDTETYEALLPILGKTDPDARLFLNGQEITVGSEGDFSTELTLAAGVNTLKFEATNNFGKKREEARTIVLKNPPEKEGAVAASESGRPRSGEGLEIRIAVGPQSAWLKVTADETESFEGLVMSGAEKIFRAAKKIYLKTGNAASTTVWINGVKQESLGGAGEIGERIFTTP